ncbi:MAG TPA: DUF4838 domain-containing protein, partial [Tepidisphaeraceae bacterium]|nr:DUF4838 domain-containing protein [Tepidisphaeraceae bacterium]
MPHLTRLFIVCFAIVWTTATGASEIAGKPDGAELAVVDAGKSTARIVVSPTAGEWEKHAASDLAKYVQQMSGAAVEIVSAADAVATAMEEKSAPVLFVGQAALVADPSLKDALAKAAKPNPVLRADAIVVRRAGNRVYLAGNNDDAHYYAVVELLSRWGCRWYMPTEFGECVPRQPTLKVGQLDRAYGPPFEARGFWLAWNGDRTGHEEFLRRNFMNKVKVPSGHALGHHVKELIPKGKTAFNVPISDEATAQHVAKKVAPTFAKGDHVMLGLDDGVYISDSPTDKELMALQYDKYFMTPSYTDAFLTFYNRVAELLREQHPQSKSKIGFLIYANITMPPVRVTEAKEPLVGYLAPIDFDPIHGMNSPLSANAREYRDLFYKWAKVMNGRMVIYDYDQSMLVWRDLPNPSHQMFRENVKHYAKAGILGVDTESRGAMATVFTNLYLRGQLMWNPGLDVDAALADFYVRFYGPLARPMAKYWGAIFKAWEQTIVSEHEYFVAPAVYTPELMKELREHLEGAYALVSRLAAEEALSRAPNPTGLGMDAR